MKYFLMTIISIFSISSQANELFIIRKTYNPKNILKYNAKIGQCQFSSQPITVQWVMGEQDGHTEDLTSSEKSFFQPVISYLKHDQTDFSIGALEKLEKLLGEKAISVRIINCVAKAYLEINNEEIQLTEIFATTGFMMKVKSLKISGIAADGRKVSREFSN